MYFSTEILFDLMRASVICFTKPNLEGLLYFAVDVKKKCDKVKIICLVIKLPTIRVKGLLLTAYMRRKNSG